jgi:hypothetical protein
MKPVWFQSMPHTELPANFRDANPSVWVDIHSTLLDPKRAHLMCNDFMHEFESAAEPGFEAVCVNDHRSNLYGQPLCIDALARPDRVLAAHRPDLAAE